MMLLRNHFNLLMMVHFESYSVITNISLLTLMAMRKLCHLTTSNQHLSNTLQHVQLQILLLLNHKHALLQYLLQRLIFLNELPDQDAMFTGPRGLLATNRSPDCSLEGGYCSNNKAISCYLPRYNKQLSSCIPHIYHLFSSVIVLRTVFIHPSQYVYI